MHEQNNSEVEHSKHAVKADRNDLLLKPDIDDSCSLSSDNDESSDKNQIT